MDWAATRKKLLSLTRRTGNDARSVVTSKVGELPAIEPTPRRSHIQATPFAGAPSLCVASGKGGTGKSVVSASLAALFGTRGRTLLVDADLGVGNAHILQNVSPEISLVDVITGDVDVADTVVACGGGVDLVGAGSGVPRMAELGAYELHLLATGVEAIEADYSTLIVDSAAGISRQTIRLAGACDLVLVVTTPDLTAMTDAYAVLKVLAARRPGIEPLLFVNRAHDSADAAETAERIGRVSERFLGDRPRLVGWAPEDPEVRRCVNGRTPVVLGAPAAPFSRALRYLAATLLNELDRVPQAGFGRRLVEDVGFTGPTEAHSRSSKGS